MFLLLAFIALVGVRDTFSQQITCGQSPKLDISIKEVMEHGIKVQKAVVDTTKSVSVDFQANGKLEIDSIEWSHNGESLPVEQDSSEEVYYSTKTEAARASGNWTMVLKTKKAATLKESCFVLSQPVIQERFTAVRGHEGYPLEVNCETDGYPQPTEMVWKKYDSKSKTFNPINNVQYANVGATKNGILKFPDATNMNGFYMCTAVSKLGEDNQVFEVRIKSKLAPLWPFLGILVELIVLIVIIGCYEYVRYRKRASNTGSSTSNKLGQSKSN